MNRKTWEEFRNTGLLLFVNQFLHIFGWSIVFAYDDGACEGEPTEVFVARVTHRGFDGESQDVAYKSISAFMAENGKELKEEADL